MRKIGAYNPDGDKLTEWRKRRINETWREFGEFTEGDYFAVPIPKPKTRAGRRLKSDAESLDVKTTKTAILYPKNGHTSARVRYDKKGDEFQLVLSGKVKRGERKGKTYRDVILLAPVDRIDDERDRIRRAAKAQGKLKKNEQLGFVLQEQNREIGASRQTFHSVDQLMEYLDRNYHRDNKAARLAFLRLVTVRRTTIEDWSKEHPAPKRKQSKARPRGYNPH